LLNFSLIEKTIKYVKEKYPQLECLFTITTNGLLLRDKFISNFLKENNVFICVSLDGYKENHDRNRVTYNNNTTYDEITRIIDTNFKKYPFIYSLCCIDYKTDLIELYKFYKENDRAEGGNIPHLLRINFINDLETNYFDSFSDEDRKNFSENYNKLIDRYIELSQNGKSDWFLDLFIGQEILGFYDRLRFDKNSRFYFVRGACIPGDKIYVLSDGTYSICEKVCIDGLKIGHVSTGLNYDSIFEIITKFNETLISKCGLCNISSLCNVCYAHLINENELGITNKQCINKYSYFIKLIKIIEEIEKINPTFFEKKINETCIKNNKSKIEKFDLLVKNLWR